MVTAAVALAIGFVTDGWHVVIVVGLSAIMCVTFWAVTRWLKP